MSFFSIEIFIIKNNKKMPIEKKIILEQSLSITREKEARRATFWNFHVKKKVRG